MTISGGISQNGEDLDEMAKLERLGTDPSSSPNEENMSIGGGSSISSWGSNFGKKNQSGGNPFEDVGFNMVGKAYYVGAYFDWLFDVIGRDATVPSEDEGCVEWEGDLFGIDHNVESSIHDCNVVVWGLVCCVDD